MNCFTMNQIIALNRFSLTHGNQQDVEILWFNAMNNNISRKKVTQRSHQHTFFEYHFTVCGNVEYEFEDKTFVCAENMAVMIPPNIKHAVKLTVEEYQRFSMTFATKEDCLLFTCLPKKATLLSSVPDEVMQSIQICANEAISNTAFSERIISNRLYECIYLLAEGADTVSSAIKKTSVDNEYLLKAKKFISDNEDTFLFSEAVADYCCICEKQLRRIFLKYENTSVTEYIHNDKIKSAQRLLLESSENIGRVSAMLGFKNEYYFNTFFSKYAGISPGDYRKTAKKE